MKKENSQWNKFMEYTKWRFIWLQESLLFRVARWTNKPFQSRIYVSIIFFSKKLYSVENFVMIVYLQNKRIVVSLIDCSNISENKSYAENPGVSFVSSALILLIRNIEIFYYLFIVWKYFWKPRRSVSQYLLLSYLKLRGI